MFGPGRYYHRYDHADPKCKPKLCQ